MGDLSPHFSRWEFTCRCGCGRGDVDPVLVDRLEHLRAALCDQPIHVLSGVRCADHNRAVGGTPRSQHVERKAADILTVGPSIQVAFAEAALLGFGGIGVYPGEGFIHVDTRPETARWCRRRKGAPYTGIPEEFYA